jgi:DEAD/DEAH box helicase domain-containing protein
MSDILSLDIETINYSWDIGGWSNKNLFKMSVIATWDGTNGTLFTNENIDLDGVEVLPLNASYVGNHITEHIEKGGKILGHNIIGFDLPVIRDSLDCWAAGDIMSKSDDAIIDTKNLVSKASKSVSHRIVTSLDVLSKCTLKEGKSMQSIDAPEQWALGNYNEVADYCLKDAQLTYELYEYGTRNGIVKSLSLDTGKEIEIEVNWI